MTNSWKVGYGHGLLLNTEEGLRQVSGLIHSLPASTHCVQEVSAQRQPSLPKRQRDGERGSLLLNAFDLDGSSMPLDNLL